MPTLTEDTQLGGQKLSRIVFSAEEIASRVTELGQEISETY